VIQTVLGPIAKDALGTTSMHEHVLSDASALQREGIEATPAQMTVQPSVLGYLRWNQLGLADNLRLDDPLLASDELALAVNRGQHAVVDATSLGLGPSHAELPEISRTSGAHIVSAYGAYLERGAPAWYESLDESEREALFLRVLTESIPGVDFRAGMLGIMGTSAELTASERSSLLAAARAAAVTGAAVSIRLDPDARTGLDMIALCTAEGVAPAKILLTNCDEYMDAAYLRDLGQAGVVLEMCFGNEASHVGRVRNPSDAERRDFFLDLLAAYPTLTWTLGASVWTKAQLTALGGGGYEHLLARVVPSLIAAGLPTARIGEMMVAVPADLLDRP
jgi:phosphotriesterase-related protein